MSNLQKKAAIPEPNEDTGIKIISAWSLNSADSKETDTHTEQDTASFRKTGGDFEDVLQTHYFPKNSESLGDNDCVVICDDDDDEDPLAEDCLLVEEKDPLDTSDLTATEPGLQPSSTNDPSSASDSYEPAKKKPKVTEDPLKKKTEPKSNFEKTFLQFAQTTYKHSNLINEASYLSSRIGGTKSLSFVGRNKTPILDKYVQDKEEIFQNSNNDARNSNSDPLRNPNPNKGPLSQNLGSTNPNSNFGALRNPNLGLTNKNSNLDGLRNPNLGSTISNSSVAGLKNPNLGPTIQNSNLDGLRNPNLGSTIQNSSLGGLRNSNMGPISKNSNLNGATNLNLGSTSQNSTLDEFRNHYLGGTMQNSNFGPYLNQNSLGGGTSQNIQALKNLMSQFSNQNSNYYNFLAQNSLANQLSGPNNSILGPNSSRSGTNSLLRQNNQHLGLNSILLGPNSTQGPNNSLSGLNNPFSSQNVAQISEQMKTVLQNSGSVPNLGNPFTENSILKQFLAQNDYNNALQNPNLAAAAAQLAQNYLQSNGSNFGPQNSNFGPQNPNFGPQNSNFGQNGPQNSNFDQNRAQNPNLGPNVPQNLNFGPNVAQNSNFLQNRSQNPNFGPNASQNSNFETGLIQNGASLLRNLNMQESGTPNSNLGLPNSNMGVPGLQNTNLGSNNPNSLLKNLRGSLNQKLGDLEPQNPGRLYYYYLNQLRNNPNQNLPQNIQNFGAGGPYDKNFVGPQQQISNLGQGNPPNQKTNSSTNKKVIKRPRKSRLLLENLEDISKTNQNGPESQNQNNLNVSNKHNRYRKENEPEISITASAPIENDPLSLDNVIKTENSGSTGAPNDYETKNLGSEAKLATNEFGESPNLTTTNLTIKTEPGISLHNHVTDPLNDFETENSDPKVNFETKNSGSEVKLAINECGESPNLPVTNLGIKTEPEISIHDERIVETERLHSSKGDHVGPNEFVAKNSTSEVKLATNELGESPNLPSTNLRVKTEPEPESEIEPNPNFFDDTEENFGERSNEIEMEPLEGPDKNFEGTVDKIGSASEVLCEVSEGNDRENFESGPNLAQIKGATEVSEAPLGPFVAQKTLNFKDAGSVSENIYWCLPCHKKFTEKNDLILHNMKHLTLNKIKSTFCIICNVKFWDRELYKRHVQSHKYRKSYFCRLCYMQLPGKSKFFNHKRRCKGNLFLKCQALYQPSNFIRKPLNSQNLTENVANSQNLTENNVHSQNLTENNFDSQNLTENSLDSQNMPEKNQDSQNFPENRLDSPNLPENVLGSQNFPEKNLNSQNLSENKVLNSQNLLANGLDSQNFESNSNQCSRNLASEGLDSQNLSSKGSDSQNLGSKGPNSPNLAIEESNSPNLGSKGSDSQNLASEESKSPNSELLSSSGPNLDSKEPDSPNLTPKESDSPNLASEGSCDPILVPEGSGSSKLGSKGLDDPNLASEEPVSPKPALEGSETPNLGPKVSGGPNLTPNESDSPNFATKGLNNPILDLNPSFRLENEPKTQNSKTGFNPSPKSNSDSQNLPQNEPNSQNAYSIPKLGNQNVPESQNSETNLRMDLDEECTHLESQNSSISRPIENYYSDLKKVVSESENADLCVITNVFSYSNEPYHKIFDSLDRKKCNKCNGNLPLDMFVPNELLGKIFKCYDCYEIFNDKVFLIKHYVEKHWLSPKKVL